MKASQTKFIDQKHLKEMPNAKCQGKQAKKRFIEILQRVTEVSKKSSYNYSDGFAQGEPVMDCLGVIGTQRITFL